MIFQPVYAQCPVCIVTVGGGLFLAEKLGIDSLLVAIWISGLNTTIAIWLGKIFKNGKYDYPYLWSIIFYLLTVGYFIYSKEIIFNKDLFWGINKSFFGLTIGFLVLAFGYFIDQIIRKYNGGKVLFFYQKVIIPLSLLLITTLIFKLLI